MKSVKRGCAALLCGLVLSQGALADAPRRVVSFNLCTDQLLVALADPDQIAGLSPYATDPVLSVVAARARAFRKLEWQAEATIPLKPDLVLVGSWDRPATRRMLERLGFRVVVVDLIADIAAAEGEIRKVADLLGHPDRGAALIASLRAARAKVAGLASPAFRTALVIERGGFTAGPRTLAATLIEAAGLHPPQGAPSGYGGFLPLEKLLALKPDLLFEKDPPA
ncbi:MAG: ABC transporter substrate-binding protein, partial [Pseudorhodoplanes sp.]